MAGYLRALPGAAGRPGLGADRDREHAGWGAGGAPSGPGGGSAAGHRASGPPPAAAGPGPRWWAGDLHTHTVHSDGVLTVAELARLARGNGLDFIAVTDHNTVSHHPELAAASRRYGITLIPARR